MALDALVRKQLRNAFKIAGPFVKELTVTSHEKVAFDFGTGVPESGSQSVVILRGIPEKKVIRRGSKGPAPEHVERVMVLAEAAASIKTYDDVAMDGKQWKLIAPLENDGFIVTLSLVEVNNG